MDTPPIALQLYTVREQTQRDMLGTLRTLAGMGYRAVEFAGYGGVPTPAIRALLDQLGMQACAAHVGLQLWDADTAQVIRDLQTLGCTWAVVPWVGEDQRGSAAAIEQLAGRLNELAARCRDEGLRFAYHNHAFEFEQVEGRTMWERLTEATDPALVAFELDVYWAEYAGADPLGLIGQYETRLPLLHIKDMAGDKTRRDMPVGDGVLPWPAILAAGRAAGTAWYIVEQDNPQQPLADVERSLHALTALLADTVGA